ncbi:zinc ribbon domain-containing protein [Dehalococcoidia bacterium]|nr:zinc ribbon domain-containing protein [Dehalococcoidia bacterium]
MPLYEFVCDICLNKTEKLWRNFMPPRSITCLSCGSNNTRRIVSRVAFRRDLSSQLDSLDPKYDKMVDNASAGTQDADPYRFLDSFTPLSAAEE